MAELELIVEGAPQPGLARQRDLIEQWREELDAFYALMHEFPVMEPDEIFEKLSGMSARASEMRTRLVRTESRRNSHFRTQEIDFFLTEVDRQFKLWSRVQSVRDFDLRMTGGAPA